MSTRSSIPAFKKKQFSTLRRFSDFLGLHDLLVEKYLRRGRIIPPAPQKNLIGKIDGFLRVVIIQQTILQAQLKLK